MVQKGGGGIQGNFFLIRKEVGNDHLERGTSSFSVTWEVGVYLGRESDNLMEGKAGSGGGGPGNLCVQDGGNYSTGE